MMKRTLGKSAADIFAPTVSPTPAPAAPAGPGRPKAHFEPYTKTTMVLFERQIVYLDRLTADIRAQSGKAMNRAEIIRALIDALEASGFPATSVTSEEDLRDRLIETMKA